MWNVRAQAAKEADKWSAKVSEMMSKKIDLAEHEKTVAELEKTMAKLNEANRKLAELEKATEQKVSELERASSKKIAELEAQVKEGKEAVEKLSDEVVGVSCGPCFACGGSGS
jgi:wobble nucleotide-excising tRNase